MANKLYIKEFETIPVVTGNAAQLWAEPCSVFQGITVSSTHAESAAFNAKTKFICITCDVDLSYLVSTAGTAAVAATDFPLWSKQYLAFAVRPLDTISGVIWA